MKKTGQTILPEPNEIERGTDEKIIPKLYSKLLSVGFKLTLSIEELERRYSSFEKSRITTLKLRQFLNILIHYLEFRQREKFAKLKKLRKWQTNLPVYQHKMEILEAVQNEQVVLIAGDTGCGKSTQVPQYLSEVGYKSIGLSFKMCLL